MPNITWIYADLDPVASGELRRLGVPALAMQDQTWTCDFVHAAAVATRSAADLAVIPLAAAQVLPQLQGRSKTAVLIEVDQMAMHTCPKADEILAGLAHRIDGVIARGPQVAAWASAILGGAAPVSFLPDPAVREVELTAAALQLGLVLPPEMPADLSGDFDLWFCEPGEYVDVDEIERLVAFLGGAAARHVAIAPPLMAEWLRQIGARAEVVDWSPQALQNAFLQTKACRFFAREEALYGRRLALAARSGAPVEAPDPVPAAHFEPQHVTAAWRTVLEEALRPQHVAISDGPPVQLLIFLDLVQDLDAILPVIDAVRARPEVDCRIGVSTLALRRSPRIAAELGGRNLAFQPLEREAVIAGSCPDIGAADGVVVVAESSLAPHAASHALTVRARHLGLPTFAFQHGVENVGLHDVEGEDAAVAVDAMFVWFPPERTPAAVPSALRPRLLHVGRSRPAAADLDYLTGALAAFESVVVIFENLHWSRYDHSWREQFLRDCTEIAVADSSRAMVLKPHHAGLWTVKNRHLVPQWPNNLILADPTDGFWEPFTAGALVQIADAVITTPSTAALDAAQAGKPVAIASYGLDLPSYAPLRLLHGQSDWSTFLLQAGSIDDARRRASFLLRTSVGDRPADAAVEHMVAIARRRRTLRETRSHS